MKRKDVLFTLLVNGLVPWGLYLLLSKYMSSVAALSIAPLAPLTDNLYVLVKRKKFDVFGMLMLITFILSLFVVWPLFWRQVLGLRWCLWYQPQPILPFPTLSFMVL